MWFAGHQRQSSLPVPELKLHQLTANSPENNVLGGMISPNGKYLAFSDLTGLHIKDVETGETRTIPRPKELGFSFEWKCAAWSPDSRRFLANSIPGAKNIREITEDDVTIWLVPLESGVPQKLRNRASAWSFSPDGSLIAFGTKSGPHGPREIWLMDANGKNARKLFESGNDDTINIASWSADGERLVYARDDGAGIRIFSRDLKGGPPILLEPSAEIEDKLIDWGISLPDGRSIFSVTEKDPIGTKTCNFWSSKHDLRTGKVIEQPRQLTHWAGFCMDPTSVTADGKKLVYTQMAGHPTVYVADLHSSGTRISNLRHFTLTDTRDYWCNWTADSKALIFYSTRSGHEAIYRQSLNRDSPELLVPDPRSEAGCAVSPDGNWILYVQGPKSDEPSGLRQLMRIPIDGGTAQTIFPLQPHQLGPACSRSSLNLCVIVELIEDRKEVILTAFDPVKGLGAELTRVKVDYNIDDPGVSLSPDGTRIAVLAAENRFKIFTIRGELINEIQVKGPSSVYNFNWAQDSKALFVTGPVPSGHVLLRLSLDGQTQPVIEGNMPVIAGRASPDGRHLAVTVGGDSANMWMMENF